MAPLDPHPGLVHFLRHGLDRDGFRRSGWLHRAASGSVVAAALCASGCSSSPGDAETEPTGSTPIEGGAGGEPTATPAVPAGAPGAESTPGGANANGEA